MFQSTSLAFFALTTRAKTGLIRKIAFLSRVRSPLLSINAVVEVEVEARADNSKRTVRKSDATAKVEGGKEGEDIVVDGAIVEHGLELFLFTSATPLFSGIDEEQFDFLVVNFPAAHPAETLSAATA